MVVAVRELVISGRGQLPPFVVARLTVTASEAVFTPSVHSTVKTKGLLKVG